LLLRVANLGTYLSTIVACKIKDGYFFLNRLSNAWRASSGRAEPADVSRSTVACIENKVHALRALLLAMRSGTGWAHSNRLPGSKWAHCRQECSGAPHLGHWLVDSNSGERMVPQ